MSRIHVIGTGGSIANDHTGPRLLDVSELLRTLNSDPYLGSIELTSEDLLSGTSTDFGPDDAARIAQAIQRSEMGGGIDGYVVTHGTDTLEEMAFLVEMLVKPAKPIIFTGALIYPDDPLTDGPRNIRDAVIAATAAELADYGVLVVFGGQLHDAGSVTKYWSTAQYCFTSGDAGPVALVQGRNIRRLRPAEKRPINVPVTRLLARVEIVTCGAGPDALALRSLIDSGVDGLVLAGMGHWRVPKILRPTLVHADSAGIVLVSAARTHSVGVISPMELSPRYSPPHPDDPPNAIRTRWTPLKARLALIAALSAHWGRDKIEEFMCG